MMSYVFRTLGMAAFLSVAAPVSPAAAQGAAWSPTRNVEIISSTGVGGAQDRLARVLQTLMQNDSLVPVPVVVVNKPGGSGALSAAYLNRTPGDGHALLVSSALMLTSHIMGHANVNYTDMTPIARLFDEYAVVAVRSDSPIRDARDLVSRLKAATDSVSIGVTVLGTAHHLSVALAAKSAGLDPKRLKMVTFKSGSDALVAAMGGHVDATVSSASNMLSALDAGSIRAIVVSAPQRLGGRMAQVPTWRELGLDSVASNFRMVFGPKGLSSEQVAYWERVLGKAVSTPAWKQDLEKNAWVDDYANSAEAKQVLSEQYATLTAVLSDLGMAKRLAPSSASVR